MSFMRIFVLSCLTVLGASVSTIDYCPPLGPVYPNLSQLSTVPALSSAAAKLSNQFLGLLAETDSTFQPNLTSFSVNLFSVHENASIFQFHHTASQLNSSGTKKVTADSVYRIGSVSKVFVVLELLLHTDKIRMEDPVTKYIPELAKISQEQHDSVSGDDDNIAEPNWSLITIGSLAGFLAGIGRDYTFGDLTTYPYPWTELGFPVVNNSAGVPTCGRDDKQPACSRKEFFAGFPHRHPAYAPYTTPAYSNAAFWILGYVVEALTAKSYADTVETDIFKPLSMGRSSVLKPNTTSWGVIPTGDSGWDFDLGGEAAAGGLYSSTNDLTSFVRAILNPPRSLSGFDSNTSRRWLKPVSHTSSLTYSVGAPWEIIRSNNLTSDGRVIDLYTKAGGIGNYVSYIILLPDYDVGLTVLAAGGNAPLYPLAEIVLNTFVPLIDTASKAAAEHKYQGQFKQSAHSSNGTVTSLLSITVDDGPGLKVNAWMSRGQDILAEYNSFFGVPGGSIDMRLYPTGLESKSKSGSMRSFRAVLNPVGQESGQGRSLLSGCSSWYGIDGFMYAGNGLDDFVFHIGANSTVLAVEPRVMREILPKAL